MEIKATYGTKRVLIRTTSHAAAHALIVLRLSRSPDVEHEVVFNGPLEVAEQAVGAVQSNGQAPISLVRLRALSQTVLPADRIPHRHEPLG